MWPKADVANGGRGRAKDAITSGNTTYSQDGRKVQIGLANVVAMWPTPSAGGHEGAETSVISVRIESNFAALKRANERRYTREDLQIDFPGDKGLDFIAALQDKQLVW